MNIEIHIPADGRDTFVHCFRNFGEDVFRSLRDSCTISIYEIDESTDRFMVRDVADNKLSQTRDQIQSIATKHYFADSLEMKIESAEP